jgi:hypothetical protein
LAYLATENDIETKYQEAKVPNAINYTRIKAHYRTKKAELVQKEADQTARTTAITEVNNH